MKEVRIYDKGEDYNERYHLTGRIFYRIHDNDLYPSLIRVILVRDADLIVVKVLATGERFVLTSKELQDNYTSIRPHYIVGAVRCDIGKKKGVMICISTYIDNHSTPEELKRAQMNVYCNRHLLASNVNISSAPEKYTFKPISYGLLLGVQTISSCDFLDYKNTDCEDKYTKFGTTIKTFNCYTNDILEEVFNYMCLKRLSNFVMNDIKNNKPIVLGNGLMGVDREMIYNFPDIEKIISTESKEKTIGEFYRSMDKIATQDFSTSNNMDYCENYLVGTNFLLSEIDPDKFYYTEYDFMKDLSLLYKDKSFNIKKISYVYNYDKKNIGCIVMMLRFKRKDMETLMKSNSNNTALNKDEMAIFLSNKY